MVLIFPLSAQETINKFKDFQIKYSSGKVLTGIKNDLNSLYPSSIQALRHAELERFRGSLVNEYVPIYLDAFNESLEKTKSEFADKEFMWKLYAEGAKSGLDILSNYALNSPFNHIANFAVPIIQHGVELYVDNKVDEGIQENNQILDKIIVDRINLLYSNGVNVVSGDDYQSFQNLFALAQADLPALTNREYPVVNKELLKYAFKYIQDNRDSIQLINLRTTNQYETIRNEFNNKFDTFTQQIHQYTEQKMEEVGEAIANLTKNQMEVLETLDGIEMRVRNNELKIKDIEKLMKTIKSDVATLASLQQEHAKLTAQNSFQISILTNYAFQNLSSDEKLQGLEKGNFDNLFSESERENLKKVLTEIKTKETIISVANNIEKYFGATYSSLIQTGVLKGEDAKKAGGLMYAIQAGSGIARIYGGDGTGILGVMSGMGGLLGKEHESGEMQMMRYMLDVMNHRLDQIEAKLNEIENKMDYLTDITISMYESMMNSFEILGGEIERINWKLDNLQEITRLQLVNDFDVCISVKDVINRLDLKFEKYNDYVENFTPNYGICLGALNSFSSTSNLGYFYFSTYNSFLSTPITEYEIKSVYDPVQELFLKQYHSNLNLALNGLMFPIGQIRFTYKPLMMLKNYEIDNINANEALLNYYNYEMINQFVELFLSLSGYFEIYGPNSGNSFTPVPLNDYLSQSLPYRGQKNLFLRNQLLELLLRK